VLIEKESGPHHKVCGEFLSREAVHYLHQAGVDPLILAPQPSARVRLSDGRQNRHRATPFQALSLSRCLLDESLLARAEAEAAASSCAALLSNRSPPTAIIGSPRSAMGRRCNPRLRLSWPPANTTSAASSAPPARQSDLDRLQNALAVGALADPRTCAMHGPLSLPRRLRGLVA
jgi:hypothetical protein